MTTPVLESMQPIRSWALALIPVVARIYQYLVNRIPRSQPPSSRLGFVTPKDAAWRHHGAMPLALLSFALLVIAWAIPKDYGKQARDRAAIAATVDVFWSMEVDDVSSNRLEAAKESAEEFTASLPERFNVVLVTSVETASVGAPPTVDQGVPNRVTDNTQMASPTAIGEAIYTSLDALKLVPPDPDHPDITAPAVIVLLSDGTSNLGRGSTVVAQQLKQLEVPVYTTTYGTQNGYVESNGRRRRMAVGRHELHVVTENSGGKKLSTESAGELNEIYQVTSSGLGYRLVPMEIMNQYTGLMIVFTVLAVMGMTSLGVRWL